MELRPFREELLDSLLLFHNEMAPARRQTSLANLREELTDSARGKGSHVRLAYDEKGLLAGFAGWVRGEGGEFFGAPFKARNADSAAMLLRHLLKEAEGAVWMRLSAFPEEIAKMAALKNAGFTPLFEFVEFECCPAKTKPVSLPAGVEDQSVIEMDPAEFARLHNASFAGVDSSLPFSAEQAREILASPLLHPGFSRLWRSRDGQAIAFSLGHKDGHIEAIGISPDSQGKGIGSRLYERILARAAMEGTMRIYSTVSSRNEGSMRLHRRLNIPEVERRTVWQKILY